jgi:hypothetical protein
MGDSVGQRSLACARFARHQQRAAQIDGGVDNLLFVLAHQKTGTGKTPGQLCIHHQIILAIAAPAKATPGRRRIFDHKFAHTLMRLAFAAEDRPVAHGSSLTR